MKTDEGLFEDWYQRAFTLEEKMTNPALRTENRLPYFAGLAEGRKMGANDTLDKIFQMNGPSRAIKILREAIRKGEQE